MAEDQLSVREIEAARIFEQGKENTLKTGKPLPIIFIPGVMGSRLRLVAHNEKWDPDSIRNMLGWAMRSADRTAEILSVRTGMAEVMSDAIKYDRALAPIWEAVDPAEDPNFYGRQRGWGGASQDFYYKVLKDLETTFNSKPYAPGEHPVYAFGYDWRRTNSHSATLLARRVRYVVDKHGADGVVLVTHSMGGLVARYACAPAGCGIGGLVKGVVHVVQPCNGATVAYRRFVEGVGQDKKGGIEGRVMGSILGGSWWGYTMIMSGTEGPVQLLPNQVYEKWLVDRDGKTVPAAGIYPYYLSGGPRSVVPTLPVEDLAKLVLEGLGDSPDAAKRRAEAYVMQLDAEWGGRIPRIHELAEAAEQARAARALARWEAYRVALATGIVRAQMFHQLVANYAHPRTFMLYAGGLATETGYRWDRAVGARLVNQAGGGDGTVPIASAKGLDAAVATQWTGSAPPRLPLAADIGALEHSACFTPEVNQQIARRIQALRLLP